MGHVKMAGYITEEQHFGTVIGRIHIFGADGETLTQFFGGESIYRITPCSEGLARNYAAGNLPRLVFVYELSHLHPPDNDDDNDDDGDYDF